MKPKYHIVWADNVDGARKGGYFHTNYIVKFTAKLRALKGITVLSINRV